MTRLAFSSTDSPEEFALFRIVFIFYISRFTSDPDAEAQEVEEAFALNRILKSVENGCKGRCSTI